MYRRHVLAAVVNDAAVDSTSPEHLPPKQCYSTPYVDEERSSLVKKQQGPTKTRRGPMRRREREMLHQLHRCMARSGVVAVAASASMVTRQMERISCMDSASKFRGRPKCSATVLASRGLLATLSAVAASSVSSASSAVLGVVARVWQAATSVANALGEPPWRAADQNAAAAGIRVTADDQRDTSLVLLWAVNFIILVAIAAVVLLAWAFVEQAAWGGTAIDEEEVDETEQDMSSTLEAQHLLDGALAVMGLSLVHPLQSAVLCGI